MHLEMHCKQTPPGGSRLARVVEEAAASSLQRAGQIAQG